MTAAAGAFSWGFIIAKAVGLAPATIAFWRLIVGFVALGSVALLTRIEWPRSWTMPVLAGIAFGLHQLVYISATQRTSVAVVPLIGALQPVLITLVSRRLVGERVPRRFLGWALLAVVGVGVVLAANLDMATRSLSGDLLAGLNLFLVAGYFLFAKRARLDGAASLTLTASIYASALLVITPALLLSNASRLPSAPIQWALVALLALGPGNGHVLVNWAHSKISAALASIVLTLVPLLASLWAFLVLDEGLTWRHGLGMLLVAIAVEGARRAEKRGQPTTNTAPTSPTNE